MCAILRPFEFQEEIRFYSDLSPSEDFWLESSFEMAGMDGSLFYQSMDDQRRSLALDSVLVVQDSQILYEAYFNGTGISHSRNIFSASKSILSALVGIAQQQGHLSSIDQPIADYLPAFYHTGMDPRKSDITIRHLLTMTAGLQWEELVTNRHIELQSNWVQGILDLPLVEIPGTTFNYSTGYSHLLSAVLTEATGMNTCEFAQEYLFDPLEITVDYWGMDPQSYFSGGWHFFITTRELAKFGLLYLRGGYWDNQEIIPRDWIQASWSHQVTLEPQHQFNYGFYWWNNTIEGYQVHTAWGYGGQMLHIVPELDLILVITSNPEFVGTIHEADGFGILEKTLIPIVRNP